MNPISTNEPSGNEESIVQALRDLAAHDASRKAGAGVEIRLMAQFRAQKRSRLQRKVALWTLAAAAGVMGGALYLETFAPQKQFAAQEPESRPNLEAQVPPLAAPPVVAEMKPVPAVVRAVPRRGNPASAATLGASSATQSVAPVQAAIEREPESVTDFYPLMTPAPPFERGQLLRVNLPASAMQMVGFPVREDRMMQPVQADVLVGEEGIPRAIRFVKADFR